MNENSNHLDFKPHKPTTGLQYHPEHIFPLGYETFDAEFTLIGEDDTMPEFTLGLNNENLKHLSGAFQIIFEKEMSRKLKADFGNILII